MYCINSFAQKQKVPFLLSYVDSSSGKYLYGYKDRTGKIVILAKYDWVDTHKMYTIATVVLHSKWFCINKKDSILFEPYIFDNGRDYLHEGLFRYLENGKIGFANLKGEKVISANFDFVSPFQNGLACFNIGGHNKQIDEYSSWEGGLWGFIDKKGEIVINSVYEIVYPFKGGYAEVYRKDGKHLVINKKGETVKELEYEKPD